MYHSKKKGFTLVELIISLSLFLVVMGVIFTFFFVGKKITNNTEIKSDMQRDAASAQNSIMNIGAQADELLYLKGAGNTDIASIYGHDAASTTIQDYINYSNIDANKVRKNGAVISGAISIRSFSFKMPKGLSVSKLTVSSDEYLEFVYKIDDKKRLRCEIYKVSSSTSSELVKKTVCENVESIIVKPVNWQMLNSYDNLKKSTNNAFTSISGLKITINMNTERTFSKDIAYSIDSIVKFRNKGRDDNNP